MRYLLKYQFSEVTSIMSEEQTGKKTLDKEEEENKFNFFKDDSPFDNFMSKTVEKNMLGYILGKTDGAAETDKQKPK